MRILFLGALIAASFVAQAEQIINTVTGDFDKDGVRDRAVLSKADASAEALDVTVYLSRNPKVVARGITWNNTGGAAGMGTLLQVSEIGSLQLYGFNDSIGRTRWAEITTFAFRGGAMLLAGYTYTYYDTIQPDSFGTCDLNFLSFRGYTRVEDVETPVRLPKNRILMSDVTDALKSEINSRYCRF